MAGIDRECADAEVFAHMRCCHLRGALLLLGSKVVYLYKPADMDMFLRIKSRRIVRRYAIAGGLAALLMAQLPASDNLILVPLEVIMVIRLGEVFGVGLRHSISQSVIIGTVATQIGRGVSEFLVGWMPVAGNIINATTAIVVIALLGRAVARDFERVVRRDEVSVGGRVR